MVYKCINSIQTLLYPASCVFCGAAGESGLDLCQPCRVGLPRNRHCCPRCALPLPQTADPNTICGRCRKKSPSFDQCLCPYLYHPPLDRLISELKFHGRLVYARLLAELLGDFVARRSDALPDLLIPVPLHRSRLRERGYNQALEIARPLARRFKLPLHPRTCVRQRATAPQTELEQAARQQNIRGAFRLNEQIEARHVAVIDDVVTTGATASELSRLLRNAGAGQVDIWAVARTP